MTKNDMFAEIGFGNKTFLSTEIKEKRINKFIKPNKVRGIYLRIWILNRVLILSTFDGISFDKKSKNRFKLLFGVEGTSK